MAGPEQAKGPEVPGTPPEADVHAWAVEQAAHLRARAWDRLDAEQVAEAIEGLAFIERHRLAETLQGLLRHLLKWDHRPEGRTRGWTAAIWNGRLDAEALLRDSPSLGPALGEVLGPAYAKARIEAADDLGLTEDVFPKACPYDFETALTRPIPWASANGDA
ncbi:DUF29 domain-containing protein [Methylobacterium trifolii]|uniref:DUF29 domain-containing protein n=1 Tax=Methylobacterium trifolii TaxID=1003092 RepID=A0ABQ4TU13_9HYPH|nr:DUF29 domain-containing protein [Methylobacterium trifolii]GJE58556.1 hypothetical protein MPOCJGCO_0638 [Methylobacterium trifolii]